MADEKYRVSVSINPHSYKDQLARNVAGHIADLDQALHSVRNGTFLKNEVRKDSTFTIHYEGSDVLSGAEERHTHKCLKSLVDELVSFLDSLIAVDQVVKSGGIRPTKDLANKQEIIDYTNIVLEKAIQKVSSDTSLTNPKKLKHFTNLAPKLREMGMGLFQIRRALVHKRETPDEDINFVYYVQKTYVNGKEVKLPHHVDKGAEVAIVIEDQSRKLSKDVPIKLSEADIRGIELGMLMLSQDLMKHFKNTP